MLVSVYDKDAPTGTLAHFDNPQLVCNVHKYVKILEISSERAIYVCTYIS